MKEKVATYLVYGEVSDYGEESVGVLELTPSYAKAILDRIAEVREHADRDLMEMAYADNGFTWLDTLYLPSSLEKLVDEARKFSIVEVTKPEDLGLLQEAGNQMVGWDGARIPTGVDRLVVFRHFPSAVWQAYPKHSYFSEKIESTCVDRDFLERVAKGE